MNAQEIWNLAFISALRYAAFAYTYSNTRNLSSSPAFAYAAISIQQRYTSFWKQVNYGQIVTPQAILLSWSRPALIPAYPTRSLFTRIIRTRLPCVFVRGVNDLHRTAMHSRSKGKTLREKCEKVIQKLMLAHNRIRVCEYTATTIFHRSEYSI